MSMRLALIFTVSSVAPAIGLAQTRATAPTESPPPEMKALMESCSAHKFETTVEVSVEGKKRSSKVKLCGKEGQSDADWAITLKDAAKKIESNDKMPQAVKDQIITALKAEISKIEIAKPIASTLPATAKPPIDRPPQYSTLPPIPTAPTAATRSNMASSGPSPGKPRLSFQCYTPGEIGGGGPCIHLERETMLTIRADEDLAGGSRLRFLRKGDERGEVALPQMRKGQSRRFNLPRELCAGVASSRVEIQILGAGASGAGANQILDTLGPYQLHC